MINIYLFIYYNKHLLFNKRGMNIKNNPYTVFIYVQLVINFEMINAYIFWWANLKKETTLKDVSINSSKILKFIIKELEDMKGFGCC